MNGVVVQKDTDNYRIDDLLKYKLPIIKSVEQLLFILGFNSEDEKKYLYSKSRKSSIYIKYRIKKKTSGTREIEVPNYRIMQIQRAINAIILNNFNMSKSCCGFVHSRNRNHLFPVEDIHKFAVLIQDQHFLS